MKKLSFLFAALVAGVVFAEDNCELIPYSVNMKATASSSSGDRKPIYAINGAGLNDDGTHNNGAANYMMWQSAESPSATNPAWFMVDLGELYDLSQIKVWNYNFTQDNGDFANRGVKDVVIYTSTTDDVTGTKTPESDARWTKLLETTFKQAKGKTSPTDPGMDPITFQTRSARYVLFLVKSQLGGGNGGLSEVQFFRSTAAVMNPILGVCSVVREGAGYSVSAMLVKNLAATVKVLAYASVDDANPVENLIGENVEAGSTVMGTLTGLAADTTYRLRVVAENNAGVATSDILDVIHTGAISIRKEQDGEELGTPAIAEVSCAAATAYDLKVSYAVAGKGYEPLSGEVIIPAGEGSAQIVVMPAYDESTEADTVTLTLSDGFYGISESAKGTTLVLANKDVPTDVVFGGKTLVYEGFSEQDYTFSTGMASARKKEGGAYPKYDEIGIGGNGWSGSQGQTYTADDGLELPKALQCAGMTSLGTAVGMNPKNNSADIRSFSTKLVSGMFAPEQVVNGRFYFRVLLTVDATAAARMNSNDKLAHNGANYGAGFAGDYADQYTSHLINCKSGISFFIMKNGAGSLKAVVGVVDKDGNLQFSVMGDVEIAKTYIFYAEAQVYNGKDAIRAGYQDCATYETALPIKKLWKTGYIFSDVFSETCYPNAIAFQGCYGTNGGYFRADEFRVGTGIDQVLAVSRGMGLMLLIK